MNDKPTLYFVYAPPSSGKLTVSKALSKESNISLFHNHLTFDVAASIYEVWSEKFTHYCEVLRVDGIKRAMKEKKDLIFTFCYVFPEDNSFVEEVISTVEKNGGQVKFIKLEVSRETLNNRVENKERGQYEKINCKSHLNDFLTKYDAFSPVPYKESFVVNTEENTVEESVSKIIKHFNL